ncbi:MAG: hypothetical protein DI538_22400 [Azospira oryzae]|nr:MAG: hypothetical protein DI538_22400 [Azospira oryzae]
MVNMHGKLKWILVGNMDNDSLSDYRRALLTSVGILLSMLTCGYYLVVNLYKNYNPSLHFYYLYLVVGSVAFLINRGGRHRLAKSIFLVCVNFVVFAFASREPEIPAVYLYFIVCSLMPLIIFDGNNKYMAAVFVALSITGYVIARFTTFSLVPSRYIEPAYLERVYNNNLVIVYALSLIAVYFLVIINHSVESSLQHREKQILEKNQTLVKTNEELDRFIYSTSHDLRAPLNSIQGLINLSEFSPSKEELTTYHQMMRERLFKLESILNEIMQYSKNAKLEVEHKSIHLREQINRVLTDVQYLEGASRIKITVDVADDLSMVTDPMRIGIILNNLISNAYKYSDLTKENPYITIRAVKTDREVTISIEDNGEGIDKIHQEKIFSMFYRATARSTGSGLGLYLVKESISKLGGAVRLTSEYGKGTLFTVVLPAS